MCVAFDEPRQRQGTRTIFNKTAVGRVKRTLDFCDDTPFYEHISIALVRHRMAAYSDILNQQFTHDYSTRKKVQEKP